MDTYNTWTILISIKFGNIRKLFVILVPHTSHITLKHTCMNVCEQSLLLNWRGEGNTTPHNLELITELRVSSKDISFHL